MAEQRDWAQEIANLSPVACDTDYGNYCFYCGAEEPSWGEAPRLEDHKPDCFWLLAKQEVDARKGDPQS